MHVATAEGDEVAVRAVRAVGGLIDMIATFNETVSRATRHRVLDAVSVHSVGNSISGHSAGEARVHLLLKRDRPGAEREVEQAVPAAGASRVDVADPESAPRCCSSHLSR